MSRLVSITAKLGLLSAIYGPFSSHRCPILVSDVEPVETGVGYDVLQFSEVLHNQ